MAIDATVPFSDGWWLSQLYNRLRRQSRECENLWQRYVGNPPLPPMNPNQREAVRWFVSKSRTNFERLIVNAVLSRLRIRGIRTAVDSDEGGDAEAFAKWKKSRGKLWALEVHKLALSMRRGYVIVGKDENDKLLVTAEDPRNCTCITDPTDPTRVLAGLKLFFDPARNEDVAYLYRIDGERCRVRVARRPRSYSAPFTVIGGFPGDAFSWSADMALLDGSGDVIIEDSEPEWLQAQGTKGTPDYLPARCPIIEFVNEDGMAEFEPHIELLDRITQQILQRMTIATVQAFKQRAMKGLPKVDPATGKEIDYDAIFIAEPGAVWNVPASVEIWESGAVDLQPILLSIRDDVKDLAAVSGTPLYTVTPDVANGSAEGASLQREQLTFKVEARQDRWELQHEAVMELMFRTDGDLPRAKPGTVGIMWAPADRPSMSERANAIAQTKGVIPRYMQLIEIWGMDPDTADQAMSQLAQDAVLDQAMAAAAAPPGAGPAAPGGARPSSQLPQATPGPNGAPRGPQRPQGLPDVTRPVQPRQTGPAPANV